MKLIYDLWYNDWNEEYEVKEFTDETYWQAHRWFCGKIGKFGDFDQDDIKCERAVMLKDNKKIVEGDRGSLNNSGLLFTVITVDDQGYITINLDENDL